MSLNAILVNRAPVTQPTLAPPWRERNAIDVSLLPPQITVEGAMIYRREVEAVFAQGKMACGSCWQTRGW